MLECQNQTIRKDPTPFSAKKLKNSQTTPRNSPKKTEILNSPIAANNSEKILVEITHCGRHQYHGILERCATNKPKKLPITCVLWS